jgi:hypothetical protein
MSAELRKDNKKYLMIRGSGKREEIYGRGLFWYQIYTDAYRK